MQFTLLTLALSFLAAASAGGHHYEDFGPASYKFEYGVADPHTGDKKSQYEHRDGHVVKGAYSLKEADGTTRLVEYVADPHSGFNAVVKKIGHAHHPAHYGGGGGGYGGVGGGYGGIGAGYGGLAGGHGGYGSGYGLGGGYGGLGHGGYGGVGGLGHGGGSYVGATHWGFNNHY